MTPHFTYAEAVSTKSGLANVPTPQVAVRIGVAAMRMERVRELLDEPCIITSWFRCDAVNKAVGGSKTSAHKDGDAIDFKVRKKTLFEAAMMIANSDIEYDQLILEYGWIHISFAPTMRRENLTKRSASAPYQKGLHA